MPAYEINFDGLVGPTHNYAGLSYGNIASMGHRKAISNPRQAALEGLAKMKFLMELGVKQAAFPPQERPHIPTLRRLGFSGSDAHILGQAYAADPALLASVSSSSSMWAANAATVSPSADTADHRVHFTPANLISQFHRSIEPQTTTRVLRTIFADPSAFIVHDPLPSAAHFSDEGAANHMRLTSNHGSQGIEVFVYGRRAFDPSAGAPGKYPARQTFEACAAIARNHRLDPQRKVFVQQNPNAIDTGAFHNDVVAVSNENTLLYHEQAFLRPIRSAFNLPMSLIEVPEQAVSLREAIGTYLFNSQLVSLPDGSIALIAPIECSESPSCRDFIAQTLTANNPIRSVHYVDVRQSMYNGGGPACLRLRVVLTDSELAKVHGSVLLTDALHGQLAEWINKHYRDSLSADDLRDPELLHESRTALDELTQILQLGSLYEFQQ